MPKDHYKTLRLESGATPAQIKEAFRALAFQYHPDRNKNDDRAQDKMAKVNEAYGALKKDGALDDVFNEEASNNPKDEKPSKGLIDDRDIGIYDRWGKLDKS
ncbi:MAG: hypothetical protein COB76_03885 [Alphaproteobacteria bacterium]|nr:MAG: hypothetical protein COB76_03885 [Alphaproteobacteria bacterium]